MKANLRPEVWQAAKKGLLRLSGRPVMEHAIRAAAAMLAAFFLAGFRVAGAVLPLPLCLSAALGLTASSFGAYVGGCLGYLVFYPFHAAEPMAAGLLVQAALCIFADQRPERDKWFPVGCAVAFTALVGFLFLLEQRFAANMVWRYILKVLVAGGGTLCFRGVLTEKNDLCRVIIIGCLSAGLCAVKIAGLPLGAVAACAMAAAAVGSPMTMTAAAIFGLALDLAWQPGCATAVFVLAAMVSRWGKRILRLGSWLVCVLFGVLLTQTDALLLAGAVLGLAGAFLVPVEVFGQKLPAVPGADPRLNAAAGLLHQMGQCLQAVRSDRPDPEMAAVFDQAAERVCRVCGGWDKCWNENAAHTVEELERAAPAMMARGRALRTDLPESFAARCSHVEGFLTAVNRELDDLSCRRQCRSRIRESRQILAGQYAVLAGAMTRPKQELNPKCRYRPEVGFRSEEAPGQTVSGDRGVTFRVGKFFYLILCDGMGTGPGAQGEAGAAIGILRTMLQAGAEPAEALEVLNGIYILRDDGGFATVDLVCADLMTAQVQLLKWGSAPSYLKWKNHLEKLGTATPPPGVGTGEDDHPERIGLSLSKGELLVLLSDGVDAGQSERFLRHYGGQSPKELAVGLIGSQPQAEDDRTAVVLALRPRKRGV